MAGRVKNINQYAGQASRCVFVISDLELSDSGKLLSIKNKFSKLDYFTGDDGKHKVTSRYTNVGGANGEAIQFQGIERKALIIDGGNHIYVLLVSSEIPGCLRSAQAKRFFSSFRLRKPH